MEMTRDLIKKMSAPDCAPAAAVFGLLMLPLMVVFEALATVPGRVVPRMLRGGR